MKKKFVMVVLVLVLFASAQSAFAVYCKGGFPHFFEGTLKIDDVDAAAGTDMRALILGEVKGTHRNGEDDE